MAQKENQIIRDTAKNCGVYLWELADYLGFPNNTTLSVMLRHKLPKEKTKELLSAIDEIAKKKEVSV